MSTFADIVSSNKVYVTNLLKLSGIPLADKDSKGMREKVTLLGNWTSKDFLLFSLSFVYSKFMNSNLGLDIKYAGSILMLVDKDTKLYKDSLGKLVPLLIKCDYKGIINLHCIIDKSELKGVSLDIDSDFSYPLKEVSPDFNQVKYPTQLAIGVRFTVPEFPYYQTEPEDIHIIEGVNQDNLKHLHFNDYSLLNDNSCEVKGNDLGVATARGIDARECQRRVYRTLSKLKIDNIQYRTDIGDSFTFNLDVLKELKYIS